MEIDVDKVIKQEVLNIRNDIDLGIESIQTQLNVVKAQIKDLETMISELQHRFRRQDNRVAKHLSNDEYGAYDV